MIFRPQPIAGRDGEDHAARQLFVGCKRQNSGMTIIPQNYFKPIGRPYELIGGVICSAVGLFFAVLTGWFVYRSHMVGNLLKTPALIFISVMIIFALGFFSIAYQLISGNASRKKQLLSNFILYLMGIVFLICSACLAIGIIYCKIQGVNFDGPASYVVTSFLIGAGSIKLANYRRKKSIQPQFSPER